MNLRGRWTHDAADSSNGRAHVAVERGRAAPAVSRVHFCGPARLDGGGRATAVTDAVGPTPATPQRLGHWIR